MMILSATVQSAKRHRSRVGCVFYVVAAIMWLLAVVQSAEELDKQRLEAQQKKDAQMKQERADRAKKNAELLAKQKVCIASVAHPPRPPSRVFSPFAHWVRFTTIHVTLMARHGSPQVFQARQCLQPLHHEQVFTT